jgi:hypothetical protein
MRPTGTQFPEKAEGWRMMASRAAVMPSVPSAEATPHQ